MQHGIRTEVVTMRICTEVRGITDCGGYFEIQTNAVPIRIWFLTDDILRIRAGFDGDFDEASYSLVITAWESRTDKLFADERRRVEPAKAELRILEDDDVCAEICGKHLRVIVHASPYRLSVVDRDGTMLYEEIPGLALREDRNKRRMHTVSIEKNDHFYGFGEKTGPLDKAQMYLRMSQGDSLGYDPDITDGLYKHIPFFIRLSEQNRRASGYFYHCTAECSFDLGRRISNYWHRHMTFTADAGDIDLFLIAGPSVNDVIERYTDLTGKPVFLPKAALGYLGSSMYYAEMPEKCDEGILKFIEHADNEGIPVDGFQLSSGYCSVDTEEGIKRCTFTWNDRRFPDPKAWFEKMRQEGITVSANVKPGMLKVHPLIEEMKQKQMFVKNPDNDEPAVGTWWGGPGYFMDFTDENTRENWKQYLKDALFAYGCTSVWNDNCEYDSLADLDARVSFEGKGSTIGEVKPVMANIMCRLSNEATIEYDSDRRPFSVCRAGHAGIQRYAQVWTGDNATSWESLKGNLPTMLGMSLSGLANTGSDIGGFFGPAPEGELLLRWVQHGIFLPRFSIHSTNSDNTVTEPWMYSDRTPLIREAIRLRYAFAPYLYSIMYRAHKTGLPMMAPLMSRFTADPQTWNESTEFLFGESILVANVLEKGAEERKVYLPAGADYYDFHTCTHYTGGQTITIPVDESSIPMFLISGAVVPMNASLGEYARMTDPVKDMKLIVVPDRDTSFMLYDDDGITNEYTEGNYCCTEITVTAGEKTVLSFADRGERANAVEHMELQIVHPDKSAVKVTLNDSEIPHILYRPDYEQAECGWYYSNRLGCVFVKYPRPEGDYKVTVSFSIFDLIGM